MCCCALRRLTITDIFELLGLLVRGRPVSHLLPSQLHQQGEQLPPLHQRQQQQPSPQQQQQQGEEAQAGEQEQQVAAAGVIGSAGRKNMSWSEVTYVSPA